MTGNHDREQTPCPVCGVPEVSGSFGLKGFTLGECARCGLLYVQDRLKEETMDQFYEEEYFGNADELTHGYENYDEMRREREITFKKYLQRILPRLTRRELVIDIGCGYGYFLNAARRHFRLLAGIDISPEALRSADPEYTLLCGSFRSELFDSDSADLVMICDLIEHLYHPVDFMAEVRQVLHPRGLVCLVTPNRRSLLSRLSGKRWVSFKLPEHVCYYDPVTIGQLLDRAGLKVVACSACGQYATLDFLRKRVSHLLFKRDVSLLPDWLSQKVIYVNSGSMLVLAARKEALEL